MSEIWESSSHIAAIAAEAETEVRRWFATAKQRTGGCGINLYYKPNADAWDRLVQQLIYHGVETGLLIFENGLYTAHSGSGDCEMNLYFLGDME